MRFLYSIFIKFYYLIILLISPFNTKAKQWIKGRKGVKFPSIPKEEKIIWIHAASLGEFEQGRPVIEAIKKEHPDYKVLLTFFSPSGYEVRKNYKQADYVYYLPLDTQRNVRRFLEYFHPSMAIFIKYEYWYNFLNQLKSLKIPYYFISAIYRPKQIFFKNYGTWFIKHLAGANHIFCQDKKSELLLNSIGLQQVTLAGDTRFDRVFEVTSSPKKIKEIEAFVKGGRTIILGSGWEPEEKILAQYLPMSKSDIKLIIAPHMIDKQHIDKITLLFKSFHPVLLSEVESGKSCSDSRVLIIDAIGFLMHLYQYGEVAVIGGGFGKGIHNILEASAFGLPVLFGPNFTKFNEAKELIEKGGAFSFKDKTEFKERIDTLLDSKKKYQEAAQISKTYVIENGGATDLILDKIFAS